MSSILLCFNTFCEDVERPREKKDCFQRTFVGEFNKDNAYCCYLSMIKQDIEIQILAMKEMNVYNIRLKIL